MLEDGADPNMRGSHHIWKTSSWPPLFRAGEKVAAVLLAGGADVNIKSASGGEFGGSTPLHVAAKNGGVKEAELLIKYGADVNALDDNGRSPLRYIYAFSNFLSPRSKEMRRLLLENGADPHAIDNKGGQVTDAPGNATAKLVFEGLLGSKGVELHDKALGEHNSQRAREILAQD